MIAFELTEEQALLQRTARAFAQNEIRPLVERVHREGDPEDPWPLVRPLVEKGAALGFTRIFLPEAQGGSGGSCVDAVLMLEELGAADVGIAADYFALNATMPLMMIRAGREEQAANLMSSVAERPLTMFAGAQSEPDVAGSELMTGGMDPAAGPKLSAVRDGNSWVLNGRKSAFVTNAGVADHYFIIARTAPDQPAFNGLSIFHVPAGTPGFSTGSRTRLIGWPLTEHAELVFDDVRIPATQMIGPENGAGMVFAGMPEMGICLAACFVGLARASYDYALRYARERKSGGKPIIEHQAVALKIADMAVDVHSARLLVWDAARACATDPRAAAMFKGPAAKTAAVDAAIANAQRCVEILGGYGVAREYEAGRFLNDAYVGYSCDFTRDVLRLSITQLL
ncbi:MAG: acyl-CoA/acyl-ACP dehydrogenase [Sphingomonadaceae bacterium]|nr:acyl-CoA/acyl-ACP dehydrogenase [Sphingomonadaceae bacterium]